MMVIYHDVGGSHSSATAANIHINKLPMDRVPDKSELLSLPTFDKITKKDIGHLIYIGDDEFGSKVYTISVQYKPNLVIPALRDMYSEIIGNSKDLYLVSTQPAVNIWMKIGGLSSRRLNLVKFGRPIVTYGTLKTYNNLINIVKEVKFDIKNGINPSLNNH